jgi:YesN/AraC family two-component response regulator
MKAPVILELDQTLTCQIKGVYHAQPLNRTSMIKIMLVEDNMHARHALKALISQQEGIIVLAEASNGQEAIRNIEQEIPDIVLMDMRMPVMDGLEATKIIKARWSQIKVIIHSMYADSQSDVLLAGADSFLAKNSNLETLLSTIRSSTSTFTITGENPLKEISPRFA